MSKPNPPKRCRWCNRETTRHCGVCLLCCDKRDERNRQLDADWTKYIPPDLRPGHRLFVDPAKKAAYRARGLKAKATRAANKDLNLHRARF
jgi:hypothetical protein